MFRVDWKRGLSFVLPGGLIALAAWGFLRPTGLPAWLQPLVNWLPVLVFGFGLVAAWRLTHARAALAVILLAVADRALSLTGTTSGGDGSLTDIATIVWSTLTVLVPLNLLGLSLLGELDASSRWTLLPVVLYVAQALGIAWLCRPESGELVVALTAPFVDPAWTAWTALPQPALLAFAAAWVFPMLRFAIRPDPMDSATAWASVTVFLAFHGRTLGWEPTNFFAASGVILSAGLMATSYRSAHYDRMTGAAGRILFNQMAARLGKRYAVGLVQIDNLDVLMRRHGPALRDQLMGVVALRIPSDAETGKLFRYSPDMFALIFPGSGGTEALGYVEPIRKRVEAVRVTLLKGNRIKEESPQTEKGTKGLLPVTISIGVAERNEHLKSFDEVLRAAHKALFLAKQAGGNQVQHLKQTSDVTLHSLLARAGGRRPAASSTGAGS
jgi:diguanylate cyclase (GGDEF)-like protein